MAAEIDPVILEFHARASAFQADLRNTTRTVDQQLGLQQKRVKKLEAEFRSSSTAISASLKGLAGTLAAAFTGRELVGLIDSYTRLQNQLRVSGLEGEKLNQVQEKLLALSGRYGVSIEELANLYGKSSQAAAELGASEAELLQITQNSAAALKITGTSAVQAQGALLGLTQALSSGTVRAEEFNQINEGGLRPLLQAAANTERFGGSVAALRQAVVEGTFSSEEFFRSILNGSAELEGKASQATLTLTGAVTALESALTVYVGSAASASGATGLLSGAIGELAENIDTIIPALATIAALLGIRVVASLGQAAAASVVLQGALAGTATQMGVVGAASFALQARLAGAATTAEALAFAMRGALGLALGAVVVALGAIVISTESAASKTQRLRRETDEARATLETYQQRLRDAGVAVDGIGAKSDEAAKKVRSLGDQLAITAQQALDFANKLQLAELIKIGAQRNEIAREREGVVRRQEQSQQARNSLLGRAFASPKLDNEVANRQRRELAQLDERDRLLRGQAEAIIAGAKAGIDVVKGTAPTGTTPTTASPTGSARSVGGGAGRSGPDFAAIELRFRDELDNIRSRIAAAESVRATTAEERAEFERRQLKLAEAQALRAIDADPELDIIDQEDGRTRREILRERLLALGEAERDNIAFRERAEIERRNLEIADERGRAQIDALRLQFSLATTEKDRRTIALQILDAEQAVLRERLQAQVNSKTLNDIDKERARIALAALDAQAAGQRKATELQFASPLKRFSINAKDSDQRVQEAAVRRIEQLNQTITDAMTDALGIEDPFLRDLIGIFLDKNIFGPLAEALDGAGGSAGGGLGSVIGSLLGSLFGRSSGGSVMAGRPYRVNEGAPMGRVEAFVPQNSGTIIPLGRMNALAQGGASPAAGGVVRVVIEEAPGFAARVQAEATGVAVEVVRQTAPGIVDAAANETLRRASRPQL